MVAQPGFFDLDHRYEALSASGDPLERLGALVDFEIFRKRLAKALRRSDRSKGGRPPYDPVLMFKVLVLQALYNLSDDQTEFQIRDRLSFMRFLGLGLEDRAPDAKTIWLFREQLVRTRAIDTLFDRFDRELEAHGYLAMSGGARQTSSEGQGCAMDHEARTGEASRGRNAARARDHDPRLRLQVAYLDRSTPWPDPALDRHRRGRQ